MNIALNASSGPVLLGVAAAVIVGAGAAYMLARLPAGALNPLSRENLAYSGVNSAGAALTGNKDFALGVWLWESNLFNRGALARERELFAPVELPPAPAPALGARIWEWFNPGALAAERALFGS